MQVILTHENADFDAIASLLAAHRLYPNAQPILPHRVNRNVQAFLGLYGPGLPFLTPETLSRGQHVKRVILVDTQKITHVRGMGKNIKDVLIIDHHDPPEELPDGWQFRGEILGDNQPACGGIISTVDTNISGRSNINAHRYL